jgi:hypothetical protein
MQYVQSYLNLGRAAILLERLRARKSVTREKLRHVVDRSNEALMTATTVFPFTLFPDTITIDRNKLNITHRVFFWTGEVINIKIDDILNVTVRVGPFLGSVQIHTRFFDPHKPYTVNLLWRKDALKIDRIMQGYCIAKDEGIDLSVLDNRELAQKLDELGKAVRGADV